MQNVKIEKELVGKGKWPNFGSVTVKGDPEAASFPSGQSDVDKEKVIQSWKTAAVLRVKPDVPVRLGFIASGHSEFLREPIQTKQGVFAVHIGSKDTTLVVWPDDQSTPVSLELVGRTTVDDPKNRDLPLY